MRHELHTKAEEWILGDPDPESRREIQQLIEKADEAELESRFAGRLEFGTAGLRGLLGAGPNRMNRAVVREATAGLARYLKRMIPDVDRRGAVVARDARRGSDVFARDAAGVLAGHGIPVYYFPDPAPTPLGAFATKHLGAAAGIVVTASHNPPEYNGFKVYWENAAQIIPPHDSGIAGEIEKAGPATSIPILDEAAATAAGLLHVIDDSLEQAYLEVIREILPHPGKGRDVRIVYTALHGVGARYMLRAFSEAGFQNVVSVPEQETPDGSFPTVRFPNPEEKGALDLALALAEKEHADLLIANDPDADRLAVGARDGHGQMRVFSGNETGVLLGTYALTQMETGGQPLVLTTIVSSVQLGLIARELGAVYGETLTGFKWIMNHALELEKKTGSRFVFGYEEALGYCAGPAVRDKDGIGAALLFADLAGWCRARGVTPWDYLEEIQRRYGLFLSSQRNFTFPGPEGAAMIRRIMEGFRGRPPSEIGMQRVVAARDYQLGIEREGEIEKPLTLPPSNVIAYELTGGARVTLRPSGTEPKIKYYFEVKELPAEGESLAVTACRGKEILETLMEEFLKLARARGQEG